MSDTYTVRPIPNEFVYPWLKERHYARRIPSVSYAYGLYEGGVLRGVCCYGVPASPPLIQGICGKENAHLVRELNRLVLDKNEKNLASFFVSSTLKLLPKPLIIVSFADTSMGHHGYVYQACNFLYTGLSEKRTNWKLKGKEHLHSATIADLSRGKLDRVGYMRETYGDDFYLEERPRKHRYIYFIGNKKERARFLSSLNYSIAPYPKGENRRYDSGKELDTQLLLI